MKMKSHITETEWVHCSDYVRALCWYTAVHSTTQYFSVMFYLFEQRRFEELMISFGRLLKLVVFLQI